MKHFLALTLMALAGVSASARLTYLPKQGGTVPEERVVAVEARAAMPKVRVNSGHAGSWTIAWKGGAVTLSLDFRQWLDGVDSPSVTVECRGQKATARRGFNSDGGFNSLAVEWNRNGSANILGGDRDLENLLTVEGLPLPADSVWIEASGDVDIELLVVETDDNDFSRLMTGYTPDEIAAAPKIRYLDRANDAELALPGGEYVLAQIPTDDGGYDLVYVSGAVTNAQYWLPGMLKGHMTPTGYVGYWRLRWYDAVGRRLSDDNYATADAEQHTISFIFPHLDSSMRFSTLPNPLTDSTK